MQKRSNCWNTTITTIAETAVRSSNELNTFSTKPLSLQSYLWAILMSLKPVRSLTPMTIWLSHRPVHFFLTGFILCTPMATWLSHRPVLLQSRLIMMVCALQNWRTYKTSSPKLRFAWKCILGKWLDNVTKGIGRVYSVLKSSVCCSKVCGNDRPRRSFQSGYVIAEQGVKPLSGIICLMKWGALQLSILSSNILQC